MEALYKSFYFAALENDDKKHECLRSSRNYSNSNTYWEYEIKQNLELSSSLEKIKNGGFLGFINST